MKAKKDLSVHYSSEKQDWETPEELFYELSEMYPGISLDVCATKGNEKCRTFFTLDGMFENEIDSYSKISDGDGLSRRWLDPHFGEPATCWMNPVYNDLGTWLKKAYDESQLGCTVVCLIPSRTDTAAWHQYVMKSAEILLIRGRVKFVGAPASAPFPSCVVVFRPGNNVPVFRSFTPRKK